MLLCWPSSVPSHPEEETDPHSIAAKVATHGCRNPSKEQCENTITQRCKWCSNVAASEVSFKGEAAGCLPPDSLGSLQYEQSCTLKGLQTQSLETKYKTQHTLKSNSYIYKMLH